MEDGKVSTYLLKDTVTGRYKVGVSYNPAVRLESIREDIQKQGFPFNFELLVFREFGSREQSLSLEKKILSEFSLYRESYMYKFSGYTECFSSLLPEDAVISAIKGFSVVTKRPIDKIDSFDLKGVTYVTSSKGDNLSLNMNILNEVKYNNHYLTLPMKVVYSYLLSLSLGWVSIPNSIICKDLGIGSRVSVKKYIEGLVTCGLVDVHRITGVPNMYKVNPIIKEV